jgi:hypothetical protein
MSDESISGTVNGPFGGYSLLSGYNGHPKGVMGTPYVPPTTVVGSYVVPCYKPITYDALTHGSGMPSYAGYFDITKAYGQNANNCNTRFVQRLCNSSVMGCGNQ